MPPKTIEFIQKLGFPIVAAIALGWFIVDTRNKHTVERGQWHSEHKEERKEWTDMVESEGAMNRETSSKLTDAVHALEMTIAKDKKE